MPITHRQFTVNSPSRTDAEEIREVDAIAQSLRGELTHVSDEIDARHQWRAKSDHIQDTFFPWLADTYTVSIEKTEGFEDTATRGNRPDAQIWLNDRGSRRVLLEVERGGTVTNGHDLKDMWKAHLSPLVKHLFLIVPNSIVDEGGKLRSDRAFVRCSARLGNFFKDERTEVDVLSLHLFGYGPEAPSRASRESAQVGLHEAQ